MQSLMKRRVRRFLPVYAMLAVPLLWYAVFRYAPMYGIVIAFKQFSVRKGILASPWAQPLTMYFQQFFSSRYALQTITNTLSISMMKLVFGMGGSILLALILNECRFKAYKRFVQTVTYLPHFLSWVIIYGIVTLFLAEDSGIVNMCLANFGIEKMALMSSPRAFRWILVFTDMWKDCGWGAVVYLAAITGIDPALYEAARMDGAGRIRQIRHVTLPSISSTIIVMLILRLGSVLNAGFDQVYIFYNVHVMDTVDIIDTWVYRTGLENLNFSLAAAVGLFKSVIGTVMIVLSNLLARRWGGSSLW